MAISQLLSGGGGGLLGAVLGEVLVRVGVDNGPLIKGLGQAQQKTVTTAAAMEGAATKGATMWKSLWTTAALGAGAAIIAFTVKGISAFSALNEQLNVATKQFGSAKSVVIDFAESTANSIGLTRAAALSAASSFGAMFQNAGILKQESAEMSVRLVQLASDFGSLRDVDPSEMLERFRSGLAGEVEALRRFGVSLDAASVQAFAYKEGIAEVGEELTLQQKYQARYLLLLEQTKVAHGDFGETLEDSLPNQLRKLGATLTDTAAKFGQQVYPVVVKVLAVLNMLVPVLGLVASNMLLVGAAFATWFALKSLPVVLFTIARGLEAIHATKAASTVLNMATGLTGLAAAAPIVAAGVLGIGLAVAGLAHEANKARAETQALLKEYLKLDTETQRKSFKEGIRDFVPAGKAGVLYQNTDLDRFNDALVEYRKNTEAAVEAEQAHETQITVTTRLIRDATGVLDAMGISYRDFAEDANKAAGAGEAAFQAFANDTLPQAAEALAQVREGFASNFDFIGGTLDRVADKSKLTATKIADAFAASNRKLDGFGKNLDTILERGGPKADGLTEKLISMGEGGVEAARLIANANDETFDRIVSGFAKGESAADRLAAKMQRQLVGTMQDIRDILLAIAKKWNVDVDINVRGQGALNSVAGAVSNVAGNHNGTYVQDPRAQAAGGIIAGASGFVTKRPTYLVGEGGYATRFGRGAEAVMPLSPNTLGRLGKAIHEAGGARGGRSLVVNINGPMMGRSGHDLAKQLAPALERELRRRELVKE